MKKTSAILCLTLLNATLLMQADAESTRVQVYPLTQTYWDVHYGETLGEIVASLLPNNPRLQQQLMHDIVQMNPDVFSDGDADTMLANRRLFLPNSMRQADSRVDRDRYSVESFSWGNIKRQK